MRTWRFDGMSLAMANSLRRVALTELRSCAADSVTIVQNDTCIPNELLAHRVAFVPFLCTGDGATVTADVRNSGAKICDVTVNDLELPPEVTAYNPYPEHPAVLCRLQPGERFAMSVELCHDVGKRHARFTPVRAFAIAPAPEGGCLISIEESGLQSAEDILARALDCLIDQLHTCETCTGTTAAATPAAPKSTSSRS
jgi:hypothetical protein